MKPVIEIDARAFGKVVNEYANRSSKQIFQTYNARVLDVVIKAFKLTVKVAKSTITADFRERGSAIVNFRRRQKGRKGISGDAMKAEIRGRREASKRSIGFVRSGWIPALRKFNASKKSSTKKPGRIPGGGRDQRGKDKGFGKPASQTIRPIAMAFNNVFIAPKVALRPLQIAFRQATQNMRGIMSGDLKRVARRHWNGKNIRAPRR